MSNGLQAKERRPLHIDLTFQNKVLNFLFSEAKSFKLFLIAIQGWVGGIVHKTLAMSFVSTHSITYHYFA